MKQRNYPFALTMLFLSSVCLIAGYWFGAEEKREIAQMHLDNVVNQQKQIAFDAKINLDMLIGLQNGNSEIAITALTSKVKNALKTPPLTGHKAIDNLSKLSTPSKATIATAAEYQSKFCTDDCLGL
ncbi:MAG: hypothetical protein GY694_19325 [Gammaproteobacteria bacterium]|nr:hypothetical protein [Gammaproteobacteria bacterium]